MISHHHIVLYLNHIYKVDNARVIRENDSGGLIINGERLIYYDFEIFRKPEVGWESGEIGLAPHMINNFISERRVKQLEEVGL